MNVVIEFFIGLPIAQQIALVALLFALLTQMVYLLAIFARPVFKKVKKIEQKANHPVSVIICAKNEEENLKQFLPKVLDQLYEQFEVIVVNDCSQDETETLLASLELKYKNLRHTTIESDKKFRHGKKLAISIGIKSAKNEHIVFTDADCYPCSQNWLQEVMNAYSNEKSIVLAYGKYDKTKGFLNKIIRYDTLMVAMQYMGMAILGKPYMGVGRNMSYKKSLFFEGKGFSRHYHILSGDDDLFINEHATKQNTAVALNHESFTSSVPPKSLVQWVKQKKRHLSSSIFYKKSDKFLLGFEPFSKMFFYLAVIFLAFTPLYIVAAAAYGFRFLLQLVVIKLGMNKFNEKGFLLMFPILDIFLPIFQLSLIFSNKINAKNRKWN